MSRNQEQHQNQNLPRGESKTLKPVAGKVSLDNADTVIEGGGGDGGGGLGAGAGSPPAAPSPVPSPTNPNGPPVFGDNITDPTPTEGGIGADYTFHTLVLWPLLHGAPWWCGNWGGPHYSGGQFKPLETLTPQEVRYLAPPIDAQDACYEEHDWCYSRGRTSGEHGFGTCDFQLQQCLRLVNSGGSGNLHSWIAEPLFSACEITNWPCPR